MPKNVILLHSDQQRGDGLGCYGNAAARTPNLDRLASEGVRFEHHYASNPVCMPSRASLLTGRHLPAHGVIDNGIPLDERELTLAQAFADRGYDTFAAGKLHLTPYLSPAGLRHGESLAAWKDGCFDGWDGPYYGFKRVALVLGHGEGAASPERGHYGRWLAANHPEAFSMTRPNGEKPEFPGVYRSNLPPEWHHSSYVADEIIKYLENADADKPFFLFGGFPDPHHPWTPPAAYAEMFDGVKLPEPRYREGEHETRPEHYRRLMNENLFPTDGGASKRPEGRHLHEIIQNTYAMVALIDHAVGRILGAVEELGLADNTIICFTSDHGDLLGDHGLLHKGQLPFASLLRVPFVLRAPGVRPGVTAAPMSNTDVMPTLMELAEVGVPDRVQGRSFIPALTGHRERIHEAAFSCGWSKASPLFRHMSLHSEAYRITWWPGQQDGELYDLEADPCEFNNLFHEVHIRGRRDQLMEELLRTYAAAGPLEPHVVCSW